MRIVLLAAVTLGLATSSAAAAPTSEWVEFPSASTPPTPFAVKRAKAKGIELKQEPGTPLRGLLVRPESAEGASPALVLLHGCDGIQPFQEQWAKDLASWGYVALLVDSHGPRGIGNDCDHSPPTAHNSFDAFGALAYLHSLPFIDPARVGAIGWGTGGRAVILVVDEKGVQQQFEQRFAASVVLYPSTIAFYRSSAPLLMLLGGADDCMPAAREQRILREVAPGPFPAQVEVFPDAGHRFDDPRFAEPVSMKLAPMFCYSSITGTGATFAYNEVTRKAASERVRAFLDEHLR